MLAFAFFLVGSIPLPDLSDGLVVTNFSALRRSHPV